MQHFEVVRFLLNRFGLEALGGPDVWQKCLKLAQKLKNEKIFQLIVRANSTEIIRENIYKNLKIVYQQYEILRERLGKAEYLCALLDRHGFYGKSKKIEENVIELENKLEKLFSNFGNQNPEDCTEELIYESKDYKETQKKLKELILEYEENLTIPHPFPEELEYLKTLQDNPNPNLNTNPSSNSNSSSQNQESEGTNSDTTISESDETSFKSAASNENDFDSAADDDQQKKSLTPAQIAKKREKKLKQYSRSKSLHDEIEKNLTQLIDKMIQNYPNIIQSDDSSGAASVIDLDVAIDHFNTWKAKVAAEAVESVRRIDGLSRQLHDALTHGYKLLDDHEKEGKIIISQLLHSTIADKDYQISISKRVDQCRSYQNHLRILLSRAEDREEKLLQIELEERKKRDEESRIEQEKRLMASPRRNMTEAEALRIAEMEVEKYNRKKEYTPEELHRLELLKEQARLKKEQEDKEAALAEKQIFDSSRVEFPEDSFSMHNISDPKIDSTSVFDSPASDIKDQDKPSVETKKEPAEPEPEEDENHHDEHVSVEEHHEGEEKNNEIDEDGHEPAVSVETKQESGENESEENKDINDDAPVDDDDENRDEPAEEGQ